MPLPGATVFLVDDDDSVRRALGRLIKSGGYAVQAFVSARKFLDGVDYNKGPGCLVLDVRMPGLNGLDLQRELQTVNAILPIIFITGHGDIPMTVRAMKAGAVDFLPKPVDGAQLLDSIGQALARAAQKRSEGAEIADIERRLEALTARERQVMELVVTGMLNKQIAFKLGTVEKTIKVHRARVMEKMEVNSLAELVRLVEKARLPQTQTQ